jgi:hypothetical protein
MLWRTDLSAAQTSNPNKRRVAREKRRRKHADKSNKRGSGCIFGWIATVDLMSRSGMRSFQTKRHLGARQDFAVAVNGNPHFKGGRRIANDKEQYRGLILCQLLVQKYAAGDWYRERVAERRSECCNAYISDNRRNRDGSDPVNGNQHSAST